MHAGMVTAMACTHGEQACGMGVGAWLRCRATGGVVGCCMGVPSMRGCSWFAQGMGRVVRKVLGGWLMSLGDGQQARSLGVGVRPARSADGALGM